MKKQSLPLSVLDEIVFNAFVENTIKSVKRLNNDCYVVYDAYDVYATFRLHYSEKNEFYYVISLHLFNSYEGAYQKIMSAVRQAEIKANEKLGGEQK